MGKGIKIKIIVLFLIFIAVGCDGTLGGFKTRKFPVSKQKLVVAIESFYQRNPQFINPPKWKEEEESWKKRGYDFLDARFFYLQDTPEELYYVSFIGDENDSIQSNANSVSIAIRAVFTRKNNRWLYEKDFNEEEKTRIENRFNNVIISKLEKYVGAKALIEKD